MTWPQIMEACLKDKRNSLFKSIKSVSDFIDGFQINLASGQTARELQRLLKENGLDVKAPRAKLAPGHYWL